MVRGGTRDIVGGKALGAALVASLAVLLSAAACTEPAAERSGAAGRTGRSPQRSDETTPEGRALMQALGAIDLSNCAVHGIDPDPDPSAVVPYTTVEVTLGQDGRVISTRMAGGTWPYKPWERCLVRHIERFRATPRPRPLQVRVTWVVPARPPPNAAGGGTP